MKLDANRLALAVAMITAVSWVVCVGFVALAPKPAMTMTGYMLHADLSTFSWSLDWRGVVIGLLSWTVIAGLGTWLTARTYNRLLPREAA